MVVVMMVVRRRALVLRNAVSSWRAKVSVLGSQEL
jgi:hypothetical protein